MRGNNCGQVFVNDINFARFYPLQSKSQAHEALTEFIQDIGIISDLHSDNAKELTLGAFGKVVKTYHICATETEPYSPWQNRAEMCIKELK